MACPRLAALLADGTGGARGFKRGVVVVGAGWIPCQSSSLLGEQRGADFRVGSVVGVVGGLAVRVLVGPSMASAGLAGGLGRVGPGGATGVSDHTRTPLADPAVGFGRYGSGHNSALARLGQSCEGWRPGPGLCAASVAAGLVWTQHPPSPRTRPSQSNLVEPTPVEGTKPTLNTGTIRLGFDTVVHTSDGSLSVRFSPLSISVQPLLTFLNGSDDGCWSVLVRSQDRVGPEPRLRGSQLEGEQGCTLFYDFRGQGPATLRVQTQPAAGSIMVEANTTLMHTIYSHLNSYCDFEVRGHRRLSLEFSPCPGELIEVRRFDYPFGRPARFAFVEEDRTFRVVEASSGEKGPFHTLARGRVASEESLTITLHDQGRALARISLADWSSQTDTTLSPTAGWGVPVNAIEFSLSDDSPSSPASIFVTLAGTSVGRGWDCVGHNPGTYRNRIHLEAAKPDSQPGQPASTNRDY